MSRQLDGGMYRAVINPVRVVFSFSGMTSPSGVGPLHTATACGGSWNVGDAVGLPVAFPAGLPAKILIVVTEVTLAPAVTEVTLEHVHKRHWHKVRNVTGF